ncbi:uncharacterized protein F4822DRAFT_215273 [Hypoxylon trugodes]|uniref:uncharacterized protein n=1 Tax=Hypoxylon trugodes TaxID=326681 RepID=UPI00218F6B99|nr:uncharacterized protein F4822DRAFT_215273 [Hypoxylon trugodes]KAI1389822.1 hypothetical protein F4822DRAFT_215273 [Hypoxylon trugodes]
MRHFPGLSPAIVLFTIFRFSAYIPPLLQNNPSHTLVSININSFHRFPPRNPPGLATSLGTNPPRMPAGCKGRLRLLSRDRILYLGDA